MRQAGWALTFTVLAAFFAAGAASAGPYSRLQILMPGETAAPGTPSGKTGSPSAQTVGVPFNVIVRATDDQWATVTSNTNVISLTSSDGSATLPGPASLVSGQRTFPVTMNSAGSFTILAHDETDGTIPDGASSAVSVFQLAGFEFSRINQKNQNAGVPMNVTITAVDASDSPVPGFSGPVNIKEVTSFGDGRTSPETVMFSNGTWSGPVTMYRADETSINRGNVNLEAWLPGSPGINGTSDPFTVHPGSFSRLQIVVPGQSPLPGSITGLTGSPSSQAAGVPFSVEVYSTDQWWNPVPSGDNVRITSSDPAASPVTGSLVNGFRQFGFTLQTNGARTLTVNDQSNGNILQMTSAPIAVNPASASGFAIATISSPQTAGQPVAVTIRAVDGSGNTVPEYAGDAILSANTGLGSISPELIQFTNGVWSGNMIFRGAGGAVSFSVSDFASPPHFGTSNSFTVNPGALAGVQVLVPGEQPRGGTADGREGTPTQQQAGTPFNLTLRAVDQFWNLVPGVNDTVALSSTDLFAGIPAETTLVNGQRIFPVTLYRTGNQRIFASNASQAGMFRDTSSAVNVSGGPYARLLILAPGETVAPGTANGRAGTATDQSINYAFNVTVHATDAWYNPVGGVNDVIRITSDDPLATLPGDSTLVDGSLQLPVRLARGGFNQIAVQSISQPTIETSTTQVRAISSGFHLEASVNPDTVGAGEPFTLTVRVTNDAGSTIQEVNSFVTLQVLNASNQTPGRGTLLSTQFQLLQGQRIVSETYTFAEPIVIVAYDDAGNAPATTEVLLVTPGSPAAVQLVSQPSWVGGNKHATVTGRLVDAFDNGVPGRSMTFQMVNGGGALTAIDSLTRSDGSAAADFLSPRDKGLSRVRASSAGLMAELDIETAFVDPNAGGGLITNYPNPFHPGETSTTIAYKLSDNATVLMRIYSLTGALVREEKFESGTTGGTAGLNEWSWDGRNGAGRVVASGGYVVLVEAQGQGETLHVMRRRVAVVR